MILCVVCSMIMKVIKVASTKTLSLMKVRILRFIDFEMELPYCIIISKVPVTNSSCIVVFSVDSTLQSKQNAEIRKHLNSWNPPTLFHYSRGWERAQSSLADVNVARNRSIRAVGTPRIGACKRFRRIK